MYSHTIQLQQLKLHYLDSEKDSLKNTNSENETIIFLHGFPQYSGAWDAQLRFFQPYYRVVAPDLPGYNLSDKPDDVDFFSVQNLIAVMAELISKINNHDSVYLVAHDWGGALAWPLVAFYPQLVKKLIILNAAHPSTFTREILNNPVQQQKSAYIRDLIAEDSPEQMRKNNFAYLKAIVSQDIDRLPFSDKQMDAHLTAWRQPKAIESMLNYYRKMPLHENKERNDAKIPNIRIERPTLILWGLDDSAFCPELLEGIEEYVPNLIVEKFAGASHWLHHEIADRVNASIKAFLIDMS